MTCGCGAEGFGSREAAACAYLGLERRLAPREGMLVEWRELEWRGVPAPRRWQLAAIAGLKAREAGVPVWPEVRLRLSRGYLPECGCVAPLKDILEDHGWAPFIAAAAYMLAGVIGAVCAIA